MEVFYNQARSGYEELVSYGPKFYSQIKEMDAIYQFAGWTLDQMAMDLEKLISLQFVSNMTREQLPFYEQFFRLSVEGLSLKERRNQVFARLYGTGKLSESELSAMGRVLYGEEANITIHMGNRLEIQIWALDVTDVVHQQFMAYLDRVLPAHIGYVIVYEEDRKGTTYLSAIWQDMEIVEVRQVML